MKKSGGNMTSGSRQQKLTGKLLVNIILLCLAALLLYRVFLLPVSSAAAASESPTTIEETTQDPLSEKLYKDLVLELEAHSSIVLETGRQRVLYEDSSEQTMPIPAAAKLMTMIIACERLPLDTMVTISSVAADIEDAADSPDDVVLETGDKYPLEYLLLRLLYHDSNSAAVAIAEQIANEESKFVELMNSQAEAYGMTRTVFANSTGQPVYTDAAADNSADFEQKPLQYTTALDLARLVVAGLQNQTFAALFSQSSEYLVLEGERIVSMRNELESIWTLSEGEVTGAFYSESQGLSTVVTTGTTDGISMVTVTANTSRASRFSDTLNLYRGCREHYMLSPLVKAGDLYASNIEQTVDGEKFGVIYRSTVYYVHPRNDDFLRQTVKYRTYGPHNRPIQRSMIVGQVLFELKDDTTIAVDVSPDRQILSTISVVDRGLEQLQNNPNLSLLIFFTVGILILALGWQTGRSVIRMIHLLILVSLDKKSKHT
jgi:D-alanyl-D-alanine carboxypeptidase (penicillin-binding protein 5/6)